MAEAAKVRVGVRVRPLLPREAAQDVAQVISHPSEKQVLVDGNAAHRFTYDHVFPVHASQRDLYASTAAQMLQPFLDVSSLSVGKCIYLLVYLTGLLCSKTKDRPARCAPAGCGRVRFRKDRASFFDEI